MEAVLSHVTRENGHRGGASWRGGSPWEVLKDVYRSTGQWKRLGLGESRSRLKSEFSRGPFLAVREDLQLVPQRGLWEGIRDPVLLVSSALRVPHLGDRHTLERGHVRAVHDEVWSQTLERRRSTRNLKQCDQRGRGGRAGLTVFRYLTNCYVGAWKEKMAIKFLTWKRTWHISGHTPDNQKTWNMLPLTSDMKPGTMPCPRRTGRVS